MKSKLLIIGAGGHGKVVADIALKMKKWEQISFLDDNENINIPFGLKKIGKSGDVIRYLDDYAIFIGLGNNEIREKLMNELKIKGAFFPNIIHPKAIIGEQVQIGYGTVIMAGVVINSSTIIGKGCIINTSCSIDHDNIIGDFVHISPGVNLAGTVKVGEGTCLGIGSIVSNDINIASKTIVGAGAVIVRDIDESGIYVGVPARRINNG